MSLDLTSKLTMALEGASPETDPIGDGGLNWNFGIKTHAMLQDHPSPTKNWVPMYKASQRNPYDSKLVTSYIANQGLVYVPVNGLGFYLLLGQSSTAGDPEEHTLSNIDSGAQPTFTVRSEMAGGAVDKFFSAVGCKLSSLSNNLDLTGDFPILTEAITYDAIKTIDPPTFDAAVASKYPTSDGTMTGTERKDRYEFNPSNTVFTWGAVDYKAELQLFNYMIMQKHKLGFISGQSELEFIDEGKYAFGFNFTLLRGADQAVWVDYNAGTQRDLVFKIYNTATRYRQTTFTNCSIIKCKGPHAQDGDEKEWLVQGMFEDMEVKVVDEIDKTVFYGD